MRWIVFGLSVFFIGIGLSSPVSAADEYGDRFYNQTPKGLADYTVEEDSMPNIAMDDMAADLQEIMPAAGDGDVPADAQKQENEVDSAQESEK
ncbi:MAG: hypothetical protein ACRBDL_06935 [Alphaproteobacteria bacterium]